MPRSKTNGIFESLYFHGKDAICSIQSISVSNVPLLYWCATVFIILFRFRLKYKPEEAKKQKEAHLENVQKRLQIFNELREQGQFDKFTFDFGDAEAIIRMLDSGKNRI